MKFYKYIICVLGISFGAFSCNEDILNTVPQDRVSDAAVFQDLAFAQAFLNQTYSGVPSGYNRGYFLLDAAVDLAETGYPWATSNNWNQGDFSPTQPPSFGAFWTNPRSQWAHGYDYIRRTNEFLANIDQVPGDEDTRKMLRGEALFLRALFYHELVNLYGGVPIINEPQTLDDLEALLVPRNTFDECVDFIVADLNEAATLLPEKHSGSNVGRATKAAALALKGRQLLYAERWAESASASLEVMNMAGYALFPNYEELFWAANNNNSEVIFARQYLTQLITHPSNQYNAVPTMGGWGGTQPTQNLVDMYEMIDGLSYEESPLYDPQDPYSNRDPRFSASILYDESVFNGQELELYEGTLQGVNGSSNDATKTGYFLRKFMDPSIVSSDNGNGYNNWNLIRLAEVLLNYAEAKNEASGPDATIYDAINAIRGRPGVEMPELPAGMNQVEMRARIRQERTIELAFEEHRFFDLRRWRDANGELVANTILNEPIYGMRINSERTTYTRFKVEDRFYQPRHRLIPIPQAEIVKYGGQLQQNPGW